MAAAFLDDLQQSGQRLLIKTDPTRQTDIVLETCNSVEIETVLSPKEKKGKNSRRNAKDVIVEFSSFFVGSFIRLQRAWQPDIIIFVKKGCFQVYYARYFTVCCI